MDINNYRFRGKDNITKKWLFGTLRIENNTPLVNDRLVDSDTLGQLAPRQDSDAHLVFEGDIIEFENDVFKVRAMVKYGEFPVSCYGFICYGWHIYVQSVTPPECDEGAEYPEYLMRNSLLEIPSFKVVGNKWDRQPHPRKD